jgi:hypothetical protein
MDMPTQTQTQHKLNMNWHHATLRGRTRQNWHSKTKAQTSDEDCMRKTLLTPWHRKLIVVDVQSDAEETKHPLKPLATCKLMGDHLNFRSSAEYTGHFIPAPKG